MLICPHVDRVPFLTLCYGTKRVLIGTLTQELKMKSILKKVVGVAVGAALVFVLMGCAPEAERSLAEKITTANVK